MTHAFCVGRKPARVIAQNGSEHGDKHLVANMIPINLIMVERSHRAATRGSGATKPLISLAIGVDTHGSTAPSRQRTARHFRSSYSCYGPLVSGQPESLADGHALPPGTTARCL